MNSNSFLFFFIPFILFTGCSGNQFVRQEAFPLGETIILRDLRLLTSFFSQVRTESYYSQFQFSRPIPWYDKHVMQVHTIEHTYGADRERVWRAVKNTALKMEKMGYRPVTDVDEKNCTIKNSSDERTVLYNVFFDEFVTQVKLVNTAQTKVIIERKIIENDHFIATPHSVASTGQIENWVLTQIQDEVGKDRSDP